MRNTGIATSASARLALPERSVAEVQVVDIVARAQPDLDLFHDVFDTLGVDVDDLFQPPALPFKRWQLWRQDDNGVTAVVASFTGRTKAEAALAQFESLSHKQAYWLEHSTEAG